MAKHYNPSIGERAQRLLNTKAFDQLPDEVSGPIATIELAPVTRIIASGSTGASGTTTAYTTPTDKDFYLTGLFVALTKDATCDTASANMSIFTTVAGATVNLAFMTVLTLTAQDKQNYLEFPFPIKIDRGVAIQMGGTFTAGAMRRGIIVYGYTEEVTKT